MLYVAQALSDIGIRLSESRTTFRDLVCCER
jgi:hypothetical protein